MGKRFFSLLVIEEKAAVWETEFIQFLAALAILNQYNWKNRMNSFCSSYHPGTIHYFLHIKLMQLNKFCPPKQQRRPLPSLRYKSFFCVVGAVAIRAFQKGPLHHRAVLGHLTCHEAYRYIADFVRPPHSVSFKIQMKGLRFLYNIFRKLCEKINICQT